MAAVILGSHFRPLRWVRLARFLFPAGHEKPADGRNALQNAGALSPYPAIQVVDMHLCMSSWVDPHRVPPAMSQPRTAAFGSDLTRYLRVLSRVRADGGERGDPRDNPHKHPIPLDCWLLICGVECTDVYIGEQSCSSVV